jgi:hypothetical protein
MDDLTNKHYWMFLIDEVGTSLSFLNTGGDRITWSFVVSGYGSWQQLLAYPVAELVAK